MRSLIRLSVLVMVFTTATWGLVPHLISYQGQLTDLAGTPLDTTVAMQFTLYSGPDAGAPVVWTENQAAVVAQSGLYQVLLGSVNPLPPSLLSGTEVWLGVRVGADTEMIPRRRLASVPYAHRVGTVDGATGGSISGPVELDSTLRAQGIRFFDGSLQTTATDTTGLATRAWVQSMGYLRGLNNVSSATGFVGGGEYNRARGDYAVVGGGGGVSMLDSNAALGSKSFIGGGYANTASGQYASVLGGGNNQVAGNYGAVAGGRDNLVTGAASTIGGGAYNRVRGFYSVIGGGGGSSSSDSNATGADRSVIGGGTGNYIGGSGDYATIGGGAHHVVSNTYAFVGGGHYNRVRGQYAVVAGGGGATAADSNSALGTGSFVGGGQRNAAVGYRGAVVGGWENSAGDTAAFVGGGRDNSAGTPFSFIGGGQGNSITQSYAAIAGGYNNWADGNGFVGAGSSNQAEWFSAVCGGALNLALGAECFVGAGNHNTLDGVAAFSSIVGGETNHINAQRAFIGGGEDNEARGEGSVIGGGMHNSTWGDCATVGGGGGMLSSADSNSAVGDYSTVPGGRRNAAVGRYSFAAGRRARANHHGAFVWADTTNLDFASTANNQFNVRSSGGVRVYTNSDATIGVSLNASDNTWNSVCDSTTKTNIRAVDTRELLEKVVSLPIKRWNFKSGDPAIEHISPMAQDFWNAFHVGSDPLKISTLDPNGIALAAIQELAKRLEAVETENTALRARVQTLEAAQTEARKEGR